MYFFHGTRSMYITYYRSFIIYVNAFFIFNYILCNMSISLFYVLCIFVI